MSESPAAAPAADAPVPADVIPPGSLPPMRYRDMPPPIPLWKMIGPSVILAGLALGSGEFVLWPYITYKSQFIFFWACLVGVATQYFLNMEITRWTLATGESTLTGFVRMGRHWAWIFLFMNIVPWIIPAWATGAAELATWLLWEPQLTAGEGGQLSITGPGQAYVGAFAIATMVGCGVLLTAGPVIYETVERAQMILVTAIVLLVIVLAACLVRWDAIAAQAEATVTLGSPVVVPVKTADRPWGLEPAMLLGALAFAGAGGTLNLGQSNYVKEKGYGMGCYIGRITSPLTGKEEPVSEIGFHFPLTAENLERWRVWWRNASWEHFFSFFLTCAVCLVLLTLVSYSIFYTPEGTIAAGAENYGSNLSFILGEANAVGERLGGAGRLLFLVMGIAILLTTELGVLDAASRISSDLIKVNWLRENAAWSESRLYYTFLWGTIALASVLIVVVGVNLEALTLFKITASLNGAVMFLYSGTLLYLNRRMLPEAIRINWWRCLVLAWSVLFFGFFTAWLAQSWLSKLWS